MARLYPSDPSVEMRHRPLQLAQNVARCPTHLHWREPEPDMQAVARNQISESHGIEYVSLADQSCVVALGDTAPVAINLEAFWLLKVVLVVEAAEALTGMRHIAGIDKLRVVAKLAVLNQSMGDIDAKAVGCLARARTRDLFELFSYSGLRQLRSGCSGRNRWQVILPACFVERPCRSSEVRDPVVGRPAVGCRITP